MFLYSSQSMIAYLLLPQDICRNFPIRSRSDTVSSSLDEQVAIESVPAEHVR